MLYRCKALRIRRCMLVPRIRGLNYGKKRGRETPRLPSTGPVPDACMSFPCFLLRSGDVHLGVSRSNHPGKC